MAAGSDGGGHDVGGLHFRRRHVRLNLSVEARGRSALDSVSLSWLEAGPERAPAIVVLHGTAGSAVTLLTEAFTAPLFGAGAPWSATDFRILVPDHLGCGQSSKPSDGLWRAFPPYTYDDQVRMFSRWCADVLGVNRLHRLVGYSMGGMEVWRWPSCSDLPVDGMVSLAATPAPMGGRNWLLRRLLIEQLESCLDEVGLVKLGWERQVQLALAQFQCATNGGDQAWQQRLPSVESTEHALEPLLGGLATQAVLDVIYQWRSGATYAGPFGAATHISECPCLLVHAEGDERNPFAIDAVKALQIRGAPVDLHVVPTSVKSTGHGTLLQSSLWVEALKYWEKKLVASDAPHSLKPSAALAGSNGFEGGDGA